MVAIPEHKTGVYCWRNRVNGKRYVGSAATSLMKRLEFYRAALPGGYCHNPHLQSAWNKYGAHNFVFSIVERCAPEKCVVKEQYWMDFYESYNREFGYNICPTAGNCLGMKHGEETIAKMRVVAKKRMTEEVKAKIKATKQRPEIQEKTRLARMNYKPSEETKRKISKTIKAQWDAREDKSHTPEHSANISKALKGRKISAQTIENRKRTMEGKTYIHPVSGKPYIWKRRGKFDATDSEQANIK